MRADEIKDRKSFEAWLNQRPESSRRREAVLLAHRAAMRALPLLSNSFGGRPRSHKVLCQTFGMNAAARFLAGDDPLTPKNFARALSKERIDLLVERNPVTSAWHSILAESSHAMPSIEDAAATSLDQAAKSIAGVLNEYEEFWKQVRKDAQLIAASVTPFDATMEPLWASVPVKWRNKWELFRVKLESIEGSSDKFNIWARWFQDCFQGQPVFGIADKKIRQTLERNIALGSTDGTFKKEFWDRYAHAINSDIARWVEEARAQDRSTLNPEIGADLSAEDFVSAPASVETVVADGQVVLAHAHPEVSLPSETAASAAASLAQGLRSLIKEADQTDRRVVAFFEQAASAIERAVDDQSALFESGRCLSALQRFAPTIDAEWHPLQAAQYHSLLLQFDKTLKKFKAWREFLKERVGPQNPVPYEEVAKGLDEITDELSYFSDIVSLQVSFKLKQIVSSFKLASERLLRNLDQNAELNAAVEEQTELLLEDAVYSVINALTSASQIFWESCGRHVVDGAKEELPLSSKALGRRMVKWVLGGSSVLVLVELAFPGALQVLRTALSSVAKFL